MTTYLELCVKGETLARELEDIEKELSTGGKQLYIDLCQYEKEKKYHLSRAMSSFKGRVPEVLWEHQVLRYYLFKYGEEQFDTLPISWLWEDWKAILDKQEEDYLKAIKDKKKQDAEDEKKRMADREEFERKEYARLKKKFENKK